MVTGLLFSGGMDSTILLRELLRHDGQVQPFYVRAGLQWETAELVAAGRVLQAMRSPQLRSLVTLQMPVSELHADHWSVTGVNVPGPATSDDAVFLPGRNGLLLYKAAVWCQLNGIERLALGVLAANPFRDARGEFFERLEQTLNAGMLPSIRIVRPLARLTKQQIMQRASGIPLEMTFSCLAPAGNLHCGRCNKCAERHRAFRDAGRSDQTEYMVKSTLEADGVRKLEQVI